MGASPVVFFAQKKSLVSKCILHTQSLNSQTVLFWSDLWNDNVMQSKFSRLFSFAKNKKISVLQFLSNNNLQSQFHLPLSEQAYQEYQRMQDYIKKYTGSTRYKRLLALYLGKQHTSSKFYKISYRNVQPPAPFLWIWDSKSSNKLKVFSWLMIMDRLNTRNLLKRKKHKLEGNNYNCILCNQNIE